MGESAFVDHGGMKPRHVEHRTLGPGVAASGIFEGMRPEGMTACDEILDLRGTPGRAARVGEMHALSVSTVWIL